MSEAHAYVPLGPNLVVTMHVLLEDFRSRFYGATAMVRKMRTLPYDYIETTGNLRRALAIRKGIWRAIMEQLGKSFDA